MDKKPLIQKIESLELEVASLKKIILDFVMEYKNQKIFNQDKFIMLERENLKKKKGWLWDY
tara:strand:+ start:2378 stop:2560 length:183 start_codon:yes stop_codon:yes gene_type:complete